MRVDGEAHQMQMILLSGQKIAFIAHKVGRRSIGRPQMSRSRIGLGDVLKSLSIFSMQSPTPDKVCAGVTATGI